MRLSNKEKELFKSVIHELDSNAQIYLFGSRTDDKKKGGDIDLLIISEKINYSDIIKIKRRIFEKIEEQKIDIIVTKEIEDTFTKIAFQTSILL